MPTKQTEKSYIDRVMADGKQRRAKEIVKAIMDYIDITPGKVSYHFVPDTGMVARYLKSEDRKYMLVEKDRQHGNIWIMRDDENELDRKVQT